MSADEAEPGDDDDHNITTHGCADSASDIPAQSIDEGNEQGLNHDHVDHPPTELTTESPTVKYMGHPLSDESPLHPPSPGVSYHSNLDHHYGDNITRTTKDHLTSLSPPWAAEHNFYQDAGITFTVYPFLFIGNLPKLLPQDVNYLEQQGCMRVPIHPILEEFVRQYFLHVHPMTPLFHEGDFWESYSQQDVGGVLPSRMSLLTFQALLFATCNKSIQALGFATIRSARSALYRRAKLLYEFDAESSAVSVAQAALLLTFWSPAGSKSTNSAWLSTAVQQARAAEAHRYNAMPHGRRANALKRLWWCCIVRDRLLSLGVRRSIQITRAHFDVDAHAPLGGADLSDEIARSRVYNPDTKQRLVDILARIVELCVVLTDVLALVYPLDTPVWDRQRLDRDAGHAQQCKVGLRRWYRTVALQLPMFSGASDGVAGTAGLGTGGEHFHHDSVVLYTNLMYMYYHSSRIAVYHHEVLHITLSNAAQNLESCNISTTPMRNNGDGVGDGMDGSQDMLAVYENRYELQDAASEVTECLKELVRRRLARWLPITAVPCTALPLFLQSVDVKLSSSDSTPEKEPMASTTTGAMTSAAPTTSPALKQHRLDILIEAMQIYQPQYEGVDWVSESICHALNLAQLDRLPRRLRSSQKPNWLHDWTDILASSPSCYLRLAFSMDIALSKNRLPEERDFPVGLRGLFASGFSPIRNFLLCAGAVVDAGVGGKAGKGNSGSAKPHQAKTSIGPVEPMRSTTSSRLSAAPRAATPMLRLVSELESASTHASSNSKGDKNSTSPNTASAAAMENTEDGLPPFMAALPSLSMGLAMITEFDVYCDMETEVMGHKNGDPNEVPFWDENERERSRNPVPAEVAGEEDDWAQLRWDAKINEPASVEFWND